LINCDAHLEGKGTGKHRTQHGEVSPEESTEGNHVSPIVCLLAGRGGNLLVDRGGLRIALAVSLDMPPNSPYPNSEFQQLTIVIDFEFPESESIEGFGFRDRVRVGRRVFSNWQWAMFSCLQV
jgi:hypothetical protein